MRRNNCGVATVSEVRIVISDSKLRPFTLAVGGEGGRVSEMSGLGVAQKYEMVSG